MGLVLNALTIVLKQNIDKNIEYQNVFFIG